MYDDIARQQQSVPQQSETGSASVQAQGRSEPTHEPPAKKRKEYKLLQIINDVVNPSPETQSTVSTAEKAKEETSAILPCKRILWYFGGQLKVIS